MHTLNAEKYEVVNVKELLNKIMKLKLNSLLIIRGKIKYIFGLEFLDNVKIYFMIVSVFDVF